MRSPLHIRKATEQDLPHIVRLLADDALGSGRESLSSSLSESYRIAFEAISRSPHIELIVGELGDGLPIALLQLTITPCITRQGSWRATLEGVRVASHCRGMGLGRQLLSYAIARAGDHNCRIVQLTTDKRRPDAKRFYESLGFEATHEGMKLAIPRADKSSTPQI
jgi:ribosomal protein S18 acetylase RimI-like enzyme